MLVQWWGDYDGMRRDHPKTLRLVETVKRAASRSTRSGDGRGEWPSRHQAPGN
jgi:hypothetical protein